jgi:hypothetical protein
MAFAGPGAAFPGFAAGVLIRPEMMSVCGM